MESDGIFDRRESGMGWGMDLREFETAIEASKDCHKLWQILVDFSRERGIQRIAYQHLVPIGAPDAQIQRIENSGFAEDWIAFYLAARAHGTTPVATYALRHGEPVHWQDIDHLKQLTAAEEEYLAALRGAGFVKGITIPVFGPNARNGMFALTFSGGVERLDAETLRDVNWACQASHLRYCGLLQSTLGETPSLSRRESEVLAWVARGKSNAMIATILGISTHTVDAHLRRIYLKLGVFDRITAALRGMGFGLIHSEI